MKKATWIVAGASLALAGTASAGIVTNFYHNFDNEVDGRLLSSELISPQVGSYSGIVEAGGFPAVQTGRFGFSGLHLTVFDGDGVDPDPKFTMNLVDSQALNVGDMTFSFDLSMRGAVNVNGLNNVALIDQSGEMLGRFSIFNRMNTLGGSAGFRINGVSGTDTAYTYAQSSPFNVSVVLGASSWGITVNDATYSDIAYLNYTAGDRVDAIIVPTQGNNTLRLAMDNLLVTSVKPPAYPFPSFPDPDPVSVWTDAMVLTNQVGAGAGGAAGFFNVTGSFGDYSLFEGFTADVVGWSFFYEDPNGLTPAVGTPHLIDGDGELDGTFYLDTIASSGRIVMNSSMDYLNGMKRENMLSGAIINSNKTYELIIGGSAGANTVNTAARFTAALTVGPGADATNTANAVAGSLTEVPLSGFSGSLSTISGADLFAAQSSGQVNFMMHHVNTNSIPGFPGSVAPEDVSNNAFVSQVGITSIQLNERWLQVAGDVNKDGEVNIEDLHTAQLYLDGNGGTPAIDRQNALIASGYTPAEALDFLNLADFDMNGDGYFDADDVAAIAALVVSDLVLEMAANGATLDLQWRSRGSSKLYDLESISDLKLGVWAGYSDGTITYTNIPGGAGGTIISVTNVPVGSTMEFFRVIEK